MEDERFEQGQQVRVVYAYDGSGVALRALATVLCETDGKVDLAIDESNAEAIKCFDGETTITVARCDVSELNSYPKVASFGWLD